MIAPVSLQTERTGKRCKEEVCAGCTNCIGWKGYFYEIVKRNVYKVLLKKIKLYITPSDYLKSALEKKHYAPIIRIYNGIQLLPQTKIKNKKELLYIGRVTKEKGVKVLIDAMHKLIKKIPNLHLTIVGEGSDKQNCKKEVEAFGLAKAVSFAGPIKKNSVATYYNDAAIVIIPSIYPDNLPTVGLEALSVGRPIIGSNIGGIPEIVKNNVTGFITDSGNANQIVTAVERLIWNTQLLEKMSKNARVYAEENFAMEKHIAELIKQYTYVLKY
jgi:glycosyltransferase involved in cell wall biosynthesis